jgi:hypothetical protein
VLVVALCGGCQVVLGLKSWTPSPDATDAPPPDAPPDSETCISNVQVAEADVALISAAGTPRDQGHGLEGILNVGVSVPEEALIRFFAPALATGQYIKDITFHGPFVTKASECAPGCGSCVAIAHDGTFSVAFATSSWDELSACYNRPSTMGTWQVVGALGAMDRGPVVGTAMYVHATELSVPLDASQVAPWLQDGKLSVIVTGSAGGVTILPQVQYSSFDPCVMAQMPVRLEYRVCQPSS